MSYLAEILFRLRQGPLRTVRWIMTRLTDAAADRRFGIASTARDSQPVAYRDMREIFELLSLAPHDVFVDLGCGLGRALCLAATYPIQAAIGVEISPELCAGARENFARIAPKIQARNVSIVQSDAAAYALPREISVAFLFNPFGGATLARVLDNIAAFPRPVRVLFCGTRSTKHFATVVPPSLRLLSQHVCATGFVALLYVHTPPHLPHERS